MDWQEHNGNNIDDRNRYGQGPEGSRNQELYRNQWMEGGQNNGRGGYGNPDYEKQAAKAIRKSFSRVGLVFIAFIAVGNLSQWAVVMILSLTGASSRLGYDLNMLLAMLSMYPLAVPMTALLMRWVPAKGTVGQERWSFGKLCGFFVVSMGVLYAGNVVGTVLMAVAGVIKGEPIMNDMQELIMSMEPWTITVAAVIMAPIMEELVFRKFLLDRIGGFGHWTAMMVSGLIFGIAHGNFYQFFYAFGLGVIFAYVYLHTGKIIYTIGFHMLINFCGSILPLGLLKVVEKNVVIGGFLAIGNMMTMFGFVICGVILLVLCRKDLYFLPPNDGLSSGKRAAAVWGNPGMILFLISGIIIFLFSL